MGTNWSMADGHVEYWKWQDMRTVKIAQQQGDWRSLLSTKGNPDLSRVQKGVWGKLGYTPAQEGAWGPPDIGQAEGSGPALDLSFRECHRFLGPESCFQRSAGRGALG